VLFIFDVDGTLIEGFLDTKPCHVCDGEGRVLIDADADPVSCPTCKGKGKIFGRHLPYGEVRLLPGRATVLGALARDGQRVALATNQGGVALGYQTYEEVMDKMGVVCARFSFFYEAAFSVHVAIGHKDAKPLLATPELLHRRKPNPGMIEDALAAHGCDAREAVYVGDLATDREAAVAAGVRFRWADDFFTDPNQGGPR
jgi:D-glycero-D-manno-heptose 1,7-bisphosphate phosphatase